MAQISKPSADSNKGTWLNSDSNNTTLYNYINQGISSPQDSTYINGQNTAKFKIDSLNDPDPSANSGLLTIRIQNGSFASMLPALYQDTTLIWEDAFAKSISPGSFTDVTWSIPTSDANNITDWSDLYIQIDEQGGSNVTISEIQLDFLGTAGGGGGATSDFIRFENGCITDIKAIVDIRI
jgi:hypothetical protein